MSGKRYATIIKNRPAHAVGLQEALTFVKENAQAKFDETIELHIRLGVDPKQSDQAVRGTVTLPHGAPSSVRVAVFTSDPQKQKDAKEAGADIVGGTELIDEVVQKKGLDADIAVTTPEMMKDLAKAAKVLGPKGLMPNPKNGTIGPDLVKIVGEVKGGKITFRMDDSGNMHVAIAKASWDTEKIVENARVLLDALRQARPSAAKGEFIRGISVSSTMGPGVAVTK